MPNALAPSSPDPDTRSKTMTRILIAGFQHETNTFAPSKAAYDNFVRGESSPAMRRGADILGLRDLNIAVGGFLRANDRLGYALLPVIWAGASPSAHVTEDAFERIAGEIVAAAAREKIDGIYLDLHGAMVTEHHDDAEGELLRRLRQAVGLAVPIVASLDLHANVTETMLAQADALIAYRTYPHVDMARTGERAADMLHLLLQRRTPLHRKARRLPFLIPINGMCTQVEPARSAYELLAGLETPPITSLSFTPGFPAADFPECGGVVWGYGEDEAAVASAVDRLYENIAGRESAWDAGFLTPDDAVQEAMRLSAGAHAPVVISDTQDNPGAGADSNTMGMVRALLRAGAEEAALGLLWDPEAARLAHAAGVGASIEIALGGQSGIAGDTPLRATYEVFHLSDGKCRYDGPMKNGMWTELGPVAGLRIEGVKIAVSSTKSQMLDRNLFRVAGIVPEQMKILVNKSSVHFRADFEPMAHAVLVAKSPGPMAADPADLPWKHLAPGMRIRPGGKAFGA
jgi:microcystin degradation protein MlrC